MASNGGLNQSTAEKVQIPAPLHQFAFGNMNSARNVVEAKEKTTFNDMPSISFSNVDVEKLSEAFMFTLVGKFDYGIPKIFEITKMLKEQSLKGSFTVSFMDRRNVIVKLFREEDFNQIWLWSEPNVGGIPFRFIKWTPKFSMEDESPIVPVWVP